LLLEMTAADGLQAIVMSVCLFQTALCSAMGEILLPALNDPTLIVSLPIRD
jgi:hypothetical protein